MRDWGHLRRNGELYGYPTCCIDQFCNDAENDRSPAALRGAISAPTAYSQR